MFPDTAAQWHAALNDFPSILFALALLLHLIGAATKRDWLTALPQRALVERAAGHDHESADPSAPGDQGADSTGQTPQHVDPPGAPPHERV